MVLVHSNIWFATIVLFVHYATSDIVNIQNVLTPSDSLKTTGASNLVLGTDGEQGVEARFGFDIDTNNYDDHLTIWEALDDPFSHKNVAGMIAFVKGDTRQHHSFEVLVKGRSPDRSSLDCLEFSSNKSTLSILSTSNCASNVASMNIDIIIAVQPGSLQFGGVGTRVDTKYLSIVVWSEVDFETYHMALHSTYGDIVCHETFYFTAHAISISSDYGTITGNWSLPGSITFSTIDGTIDLDLPPKRWSSGPWTGGILAAQSVSGDIDIRMPFAFDKLSLRNSTTNITTAHGAVHASLVHGAVTHIQSVSGTINATLLPYWAFDEFRGVQHNYITTTCTLCITTVDLLTPIVDDYFKIRPLYFSTSKHVTGVGAATLSYPREWAGVAEWKVEIGVANVSGVDYEVVEDNGLYGKIQRLPLGSDLYAEVREGKLELIMKD
ncbi:hypothetical protein CC86DRAFT_368710 [Ophiobolus disseminans]|uniref:Adhesin domain-containing protein n=1 Tax=Ophiobolus disseminans TaxID=1469910 RepID=A0A6A7A5B9_9PLEO|nr:hypothetical protein CC86DRAFT_368710 [Ophiobolus disseminans]